MQFPTEESSENSTLCSTIGRKLKGVLSWDLPVVICTNEAMLSSFPENTAFFFFSYITALSQSVLWPQTRGIQPI